MVDKLTGVDTVALAEKQRSQFLENQSKGKDAPPAISVKTDPPPGGKTDPPPEGGKTDPPAGGKTDPPAPTDPPQQKTLSEQLKDVPKDELEKTLSELGISIQKPELTDDQKKEFEQNRKKELFNFATNSKLATTDELVKFEVLKDADPENLLFEEFSANLKAENAKEVEANPKAKVLDDEDIKDLYDEYYHQNDDASETLKSLGAKNRKTDAENRKSEKLSKYNQISELFESEEKLNVTKKEYAGAINGFIKEVKQTVPVQIKYTSPEGKESTFDLTIPIADTVENAQKLAEEYFTLDPIAYQFINSKNYNKKENLQDSFNNFALIKNRNVILNAIFESGFSEGIKEGRVGVTQPIEHHTPIEKVNIPEGGIGKKAAENMFKN